MTDENGKTPEEKTPEQKRLDAAWAGLEAWGEEFQAGIEAFNPRELAADGSMATLAARFRVMLRPEKE